MENGRHEENAWVDDRVDALAPRDFEPDATAAWARLRERSMPMRGATFATWAAGAAVVGVMVLLLPWPRAAAARLWDRLTVGRVEVVSVGSDADVPDSVMAFFQMREREAMQPHGVGNLANVAAIAGFQPSLPPPGVLAGDPALSVVKTATMSTAPIRVDELRAHLARIGASDLRVPDEWEGASLAVEGGPIVIAHYSDAAVQLIQARQLQLKMPPGFALERFMEIAFRVFGRNAEDARMFGGRIAANPPLLMVLTPGHHSAVREIMFEKGSGILVGDPEGDMCLFLNMMDRIFFISASQLTEDRALAIARSIQ